MSVEQPRTIDFVSVAENPPRARLTISDHLPWDDETHLDKLEAKLGAYRDFTASGKVFDQYPQLRDLPLWIDVKFVFEPTDVALVYLDTAKEVIEADGIRFTWEVVRPK
jgi:hypothetical protein